jgi:predicted DNA-binding transcriptional regulator YafY
MNETQANVCNLTFALANGYRCGMSYTDRDGVLSARLIVPLSIERTLGGIAIVRAFDTQRNAPRTFVLDRIGNVTV